MNIVLPTILVTGTSGFVGRALCDTLLHTRHTGYSTEYALVPAVRSPRGLPGECVVGEINGKTDWREAAYTEADTPAPEDAMPMWSSC